MAVTPFVYISTTTKVKNSIFHFQKVRTVCLDLLRVLTINHMDLAMENSALEALRVRLRTTSKYNEKWDILKPLIEHLFLKEGRKLKDICSILKRLFDFPAK